MDGQEGPEDVRARLREEISPDKSPDVYRILLVGSSQTWGAGARRVDQIWPRLLEHRLNERLGEARRVECVNTGICAMTSTDLLSFYRDEWIDWKPDLVVINLSLNDGRDPAFQPNLREFVSLNEARGIQTVLMQEAVCTEIGPRVPSANHQRMAELASEVGVLCVPMHDHVDAQADCGYLWWDKIHLTSFGQQLLADELARRLEPLVTGG